MCQRMKFIIIMSRGGVHNISRGELYIKSYYIRMGFMSEGGTICESLIGKH